MTTRPPWNNGQDDRSPENPLRSPQNSQRPIGDSPQARTSRGPASGGFAPPRLEPPSPNGAPARPDFEDLPTRRMSAAPAPSVSDIETQYLPGPARATRPPAAMRPARNRRPRPRWLTGMVLALALVLIGVRAAFASTAFILPGGEIPGWSKLPPTVCKLCVPTVAGEKPLTQTEYATLL